MGSFIMGLFMYIGGIFLFFMFLGLLPDISPMPVDSVSVKNPPLSYYETSNRTESFSEGNEKISSDDFVKRVKRSFSPYEKREESRDFKKIEYAGSKEDFIDAVKDYYGGVVDSVKVFENGRVIEFRGKLFDSDGNIYAFHKKIDGKLRELGFKEARYLWYGSDGDYTIFNLTR